MLQVPLLCWGSQLGLRVGGGGDAVLGAEASPYMVVASCRFALCDKPFPSPQPGSYVVHAKTYPLDTVMALSSKRQLHVAYTNAAAAQPCCCGTVYYTTAFVRLCPAAPDLTGNTMSGRPDGYGLRVWSFTRDSEMLQVGRHGVDVTPIHIGSHTVP